MASGWTSPNRAIEPKMEVAPSSQTVVRAWETLNPGQWGTVPLPGHYRPARPRSLAPAPKAQAPLAPPRGSAPPRGPAPDASLFDPRAAARLRRLGTGLGSGVGAGVGFTLCGFGDFGCAGISRASRPSL